MNGDIGKLPPGAVYSATPESLGSVRGTVVTNTSSLDYSVMNGGSVTGELMLSPVTMGAVEPSSQHSTTGLGGTLGAAVTAADGTDTASSTSSSSSGGGGGGSSGSGCIPSISTTATAVAGALGVGVSVGYAPVQVAPLDVQLSSGLMTDLPTSGIPLDQLKQMLSSQLEYYFSRY